LMRWTAIAHLAGTGRQSVKASDAAVIDADQDQVADGSQDD
jgi:hypothetical protein